MSRSLDELLDGFDELCRRLRSNDRWTTRIDLVLDFTSQAMPCRAESLALVAAALQNNTAVTEIRINVRDPLRVVLPLNGAKLLARWIQNSKSLRRFSLSAHAMMISEKRLLTALSRCESLEELSLCNINLSLSGLALSSLLLASKRRLKALQLMNCLDNCLPHQHQVVERIAQGLANNTTLEVLHVAGQRSPVLKELLRPLARHPTLRVLVVDGFPELQCLPEFFRSNATVEHLELHNVGLTTSLEPILLAVKHSTSVKRVTFGATCSRQVHQYVPQTIRHLLHRKSDSAPGLAAGRTCRVEELCFASNKCTPTEFCDLVAALCSDTHIRRITLPGYCIHGHDAAIGLRNLLLCNRTLEYIKFPFIDMGSPNRSRDLANAVAINPVIQHLDLSSCRLGTVGVHFLARALRAGHPSLHTLELDLCDIGPDAMPDMVTLLRGHDIKNLSLRGNPVGDAGIAMLAESLSQDRMLQLNTLNLERTWCYHYGFLKLLQALDRNPGCIWHLLMDGNPLSLNAFQGLAEHLPQIQGLQQLDLSWVGLPVQVVPALLIGFEQNNSLLRVRSRTGSARSIPDMSLLQDCMDFVCRRNRLRNFGAVQINVCPACEQHPDKDPVAIEGTAAGSATSPTAMTALWPMALAWAGRSPSALYETLRSHNSLFLEQSSMVSTESLGVAKISRDSNGVFRQYSMFARVPYGN